jgi:hypothetical protein
VCASHPLIRPDVAVMEGGAGRLCALVSLFCAYRLPLFAAGWREEDAGVATRWTSRVKPRLPKATPRSPYRHRPCWWSTGA